MKMFFFLQWKITWPSICFLAEDDSSPARPSVMPGCPKSPGRGGISFPAARIWTMYLVKLTGGRKGKSTIYMTSTGSLTSPGKFKLVSPMQPNFPLDILSGSQGKGNTVPRAIWLMERRSNCRGTVLPKAWLPHQIARRQFGCTGRVLFPPFSPK